MVSETKGMKGASSWDRLTSTWYSVWYALRLSASDSDFQNRRRERRTYQVERSSTKASSRRAAVGGSYASIAFSTSAMVTASSASSQRSSSARSDTGTAAPAGSKPASLA